MLDIESREQVLHRMQEQVGGQVVDGTVGTFCKERLYNDDLSAQADEAVYVEHDFCEIRVPGNFRANHKELVRKIYPDGHEVTVNEKPMTKYALAWDAFLRGEDLRPDGTPLEDCAAIPQSRVAGLKQAQIRTVEELAGLPDASLPRVGHDARALQRAAQAYIAEHDEQAGLAKRVEELEALLAQKDVELAVNGVGTDGDTEEDRPRSRRGTRANRS